MTMNQVAQTRLIAFLIEVNGIKNARSLFRHYRGFPHGLKTEVAPFFDLQTEADEDIRIAVDKTPDQTQCLVTVRYTRRIACATPTLLAATSLPESVLSLIDEYAHHHIYLQFKIDFAPDYPFTPPTWSLAHTDIAVDYDVHAHGGLTLPEYYAYIVDLHNASYRGDDDNDDAERVVNRRKRKPWSPVITIEKDVLQFVTRIHHFRYLSYP